MNIPINLLPINKDFRICTRQISKDCVKMCHYSEMAKNRKMCKECRKVDEHEIYMKRREAKAIQRKSLMKKEKNY